MTDVSVALAEVLQPLRELDSKLEQEETQLQTRLTALRAERRKLTQVLRTLAPPTTPVKQPAKRGSGQAHYYVSEETMRQIRAAVGGLSDEYNAREIATLTGLSQQTVRAALYQLRDQGEVRLTAMKGSGGAAHFKTTGKGQPQVGVPSGNGPERS